MFIFLSFVAALISLYYIGVMADSYGSDTTYLAPLVILFIFSVLSIVRELRRKNSYFFEYDNDNSSYYENDSHIRHYRSNNNNTNIVSYYNPHYNNPISIKANEDVEYFEPNKGKEHPKEKMLVHYTSNSEIREKLKELEKSKWFRFKRSIFSLFGIDLNEKYTNKFKKPIKATCKIVPLQNKEDDRRFMPRLTYAQERELQEYNSVVKYIGRSCEITFDKNILEDDK